MEILVTNDDSISAKGVNVLAEIMSEYGHVTVIAPSQVQSGKGTSLSLISRQYLHSISHTEKIDKYSFDGTPVDCIKLAMNFFFKDKKPDFIVSGINHGSNNSVAALYSGTLGACIEGAIYQIPSIGFSLCSHDIDPDFSGTRKYIPQIFNKFINDFIPPSTYLNVNIPDIPAEEIKGIKFGHRGKGMWVEEYTKEVDEENRDYYFMKGRFHNLEPDNNEADHNITKNGYISIVPHTIDNTNYKTLEDLKENWKF